MKRILAAMLFFCLTACTSSAPDVPKPQRQALEVPKMQSYVNDYANLLSVQERKTLAHKLAGYGKEAGNQIVVLTIPSLDGAVMEEFSIKVAEAWKVGQKGKGNGLIILASKKDGLVRFEVGSGLEDRLTDVRSRKIINEMKPYFKKGEIYKAFDLGIDEIAQTLKAG